MYTKAKEVSKAVKECQRGRVDWELLFDVGRTLSCILPTLLAPMRGKPFRTLQRRALAHHSMCCFHYICGSCCFVCHQCWALAAPVFGSLCYLHAAGGHPMAHKVRSGHQAGTQWAPRGYPVGTKRVTNGPFCKRLSESWALRPKVFKRVGLAPKAFEISGPCSKSKGSLFL